MHKPVAYNVYHFEISNKLSLKFLVQKMACPPGNRYMNLDVREGVWGGGGGGVVGLNVFVCMHVRRRLGKRKIVWASAA